jgi:hypothetical protein
MDVDTLATLLNPPRGAGGSDQEVQPGVGLLLRKAAAAAAGVTDGGQQQLQQQTRDGGGGGSASVAHEIKRLLQEKVDLLATGLYTRDDAVILQIEARVQALAG